MLTFLCNPPKNTSSGISSFNAATEEWALVEPSGGTPPTCSYHSCTIHRGEMYVFGGVYPEPDPTPDKCSNKLHIFNFSQRNWYEPFLSGTLPCPRSGHTATLSGDELFIFGGWDMPDVYNDLFMLDLSKILVTVWRVFRRKHS